jgi:hypothetical protein
MLTYQSTIATYRKILERNPGKALRLYDSSKVLVVLHGDALRWGSAKEDGSIDLADMPEVDGHAWIGCGWFGEHEATKKALDNPILIDLPVISAYTSSQGLTINPAPAGSPEGLVRVTAPWSGEMLRGMRVAAWRWKDGRGFWDYATHWSTGPQDRQERVYTEADMLAVLASRDTAIAALKSLDAESALDCSGCETDYLLAAKNKAKAVLCDAGESDFDRILMQVLES